MRSLAEPTDVDSALLRNQIDICFLKAMAAERDQMEAIDMRCHDEPSVNSNAGFISVNGRTGNSSTQSFAMQSNGSRPPRHGGVRGSRSTRGAIVQRMPNNRQWRNQRNNNRMHSGYHDPNMMIPPHMQHGYYPPHFNHVYHGGYAPNQYMQPSLNHTIYGWNNPYGGNDYSNLHNSMSTNYDYYHGSHFEPSMEHEQSFNIKCDDSVANTSIASHNNFEGTHFSYNVTGHNLNQLHDNSIMHSANASFDEASLNAPEPTNMQTPSKHFGATNFGTPDSPSWAHLQSVPGLTTPVTHHGHHMISQDNPSVSSNLGIRTNQTFMNAKPLLINHNLNHYPPQVR